MKKFLRKLFNRTTLVLFILVLEFAFIIAAFYICDMFDDPNSFFGQNFPQLSWIGLLDNVLILFLLIFQVIIFFRVVYRQMDAEFKIPWIIILLLLPLVGSLIYIVFGVDLLYNNDIIGPMEFMICDRPFDYPAQWYHCYRFFWAGVLLNLIAWSAGMISMIILLAYSLLVRYKSSLKSLINIEL